MAKKKMGGLGKGLDLLFADLPETSSDDAAASTLPLREIEPRDILRANRMMYAESLLALVLGLAVRLMLVL